MSSFRLVQGTATRTKNVWAVRAKVRALALVQGGSTAAQAIAAVAGEFGIDVSATPSYTKNAGSHIGRFRTEVARLLQKENNDEVVAACQEFGIPVEPVE
jgi:hypothetical protein